MTNKHGGSTKPVAVGEVEGFDVEVFAWGWNKKQVFYYVISKEGETIEKSAAIYPAMEEALNAALLVVIPDTDVVEFTEPTERDFEAINALLYVGGMNFDITSLDQAVGLYAEFCKTANAIDEVKAKAEKDILDIEDSLATVERPGEGHIKNLNDIHQIFQAQCDVLKQITERNIQTLDAFISHFLKR